MAKVEFPDKFRCLFKPKRYKVLYGGRGGAKSWAVARALLIIGTTRPIRVLCAREFQNSIRDSVHQLLSDQINALGCTGFYAAKQTEIIGKNGTKFSFEGLRHNVSKIKSYEGVDVVWVEEAHAVTKASWGVLIPTIRKPGSEIWLTFNPEFEDDNTYERFVANPPKESFVVEVNYRDNPWFPEVLEAERLELKERDPDDYDHVWEGRPRRWLEGAIYADELRAAHEQGRIAKVAHDPNLCVYTAWDIGHTDDTAIWWYQVLAGEVHIIESYARSGGSPSHFASQVLGKEVDLDIIDGEVRVNIGADIPGLEHRRAYEYETHWLPHDARAKTLSAHGKSTQEQLSEAFGWGAVQIVPKLDREDGIKAARTVFKRCWFDESLTSDGVKALRRYRRELQTDGVSLKPQPKHDQASHYADAFRYLAVACESAPHVEPPATPNLDAWGRPSEPDNWKAA